MENSSSRRVVITGVGVVSPLGNDVAALVQALREGESGIRPLTRIPQGVLPIDHGAEAVHFTGDISEYGPLEKKMQRSIKRNNKVMCREIEMGVAVAQLAMTNAGFDPERFDHARTGVVYGCDYIMSQPEEFSEAIKRSRDEHGNFDFSRYGEFGRPQVYPLWLLKYLPNMPASHIAIHNDLRGPNNSITLREASAGAAIGEAFSTICRGHADALIVGATGSRIHPLRTLHAAMQETLAASRDDPSEMSRPFDLSRDGSVVGEGAAAIVCESLEHAHARDATILGEVVGCGSSAAGPHSGADFLKTAVANALRAALRGGSPDQIGHVHAHGLASVESDRQEAEAIAEVFGDASQQPPVTTAKGHFGNLGAGGGMVEIVASLEALGGDLFAIRNCDRLDSACPINACRAPMEAGDEFVSVNVTPQGQASAVRIRGSVPA